MKKLLGDRIASPGLMRACKYALVSVSIIFIARAALVANIDDIFSGLSLWSGVGLIMLSLIYGFSLFLLAVAWRYSFPVTSEPVRMRDAFTVYGLSIFPKYIPGVILQYVSRQGLGAVYGWPQRGIAIATGVELALHVIGALLAFVICDIVLGLGYRTPLIGTIVLASCVGFLWLRWNKTDSLRRLVTALLAQLVFFMGMAVVASLCAVLLIQSADPVIGPLFLLAWLIAFVVPGLPGGIGVREAALIWLIGSMAGAGPALLFSGAMRVITLGGDLAFGCAALLYRRYVAKSEVLLW